jgi:hypothetical protein
MAEFRLERFKYNWKGDWAADVSYKRDDIVRVNGKSYVCIVTHVSSAKFVTDLTAILPGSIPPQPQPKWTVMTSGREFVGDYAADVDYNLGDIVRNDGALWICTFSHTSTQAPSEVAYWELFAAGVEFKGNWTTNTLYGPGAIVKYNGILYKSTAAHLSTSSVETDIANWEVFNEGIEYRSDWSQGETYRKNDVIKYGGTIYRCTETHTASSASLDETKFVIISFGSQFDGEWNNSTYYNIGDIVKHNGFMYYAITNNVNSKPFTDSGSTDWIVLSKTYTFAGDWSLTGTYKTGDVVLRGGDLYQAIQDIGTGAADGSTSDYLDNTIWELLIPGKDWKGIWDEGIFYSVNDVVYHLGTTYKCTFEHTSDARNFPGDNGNIEDYWEIVFAGIQPAAFRKAGDLITYGFSRDLDAVQDTSTTGDVRVPIGESEQLLSITEDLELYWRDISQDADQIYVSTNGVDDVNRGTEQKPFRTIKYAADYVEDTFEPLTPVIIRVSTGVFEEIAPIVVPAGCAINGDELRSTTVKAAGPDPAYVRDSDALPAYLNYFTSILTSVATGTLITPQPGNDIEQATTANTNDFPVGNSAGISQVVNLITDYTNFIEFNTANGSVNPTVSGSNELNPDPIAGNVSTALELNKLFLREDMLAYLRNTFPSSTFDYTHISNDIWALLRAIIRDVKYSGNSSTLLAGQRYSNAYNGSQLGDLFRLRDSTGLRDMTTGGLQGVLNPPGVFDLYQKPTGGACVALDPGWGPEDERTWIVNRSPYVQGVTNTGVGCVGMKVDGSLHSGGNKSMTANDFTQVLSDGVGAWISNNGRAELVSVFTYYCQIGYFAEDGGVIRAANGNNSYGRYGSIADGESDDEIPQTATVFNRNNQAQVAEAFAGGSNDELKVFEYLNAGEEYTSADATIIGAGANADVEFTDFRDGGLFEARLASADGSSAKGGSGYLIRQGSAQETLGASSTIKLSQNDVTQFLSEIEGMRLFITDGTGVGQYGYITDFDFVTKTVTVARESDDQAGWDHVIPGTPVATDLDLTTRYRIEPRIVASSPDFSTQSYNLITNRLYVDAEYAGFTETFTGLTSGSTQLWEDSVNVSVKVQSVISPVAMTFSATSSDNNLPDVPVTIRGNTSGTEVTITAFTANTGAVLEANITGDPSNFVQDETLTLVYASGSGDTFDDDPIPAVFTVVRKGKDYETTITTPGAGYSVGDKIVIVGTQLGGATPDNDLTIVVTDVSDDSTSSIQTFSASGEGRDGRFIALTDSAFARYSDDGIIWNERSLAFSGSYKKLIAGDNKYIALASNEARISYSLTGTEWSEVALPTTANWQDGVYGGGKFVIVANDVPDVLVSSDGTNWSSANIPDDTGGADSTISQWSYIVYGKGKYVAVSANDFATATSTDGVTWTRNDEVLPDLSPAADWDIVAVTYGNNRFLIVDSLGRTAYSFDGVTWYNGGTISEGDFVPVDAKYSQGIFFVIGNENGTTGTTTCLTSEYGLIWTARSMPSSKLWTGLTFGKVNGVSKWLAVASAASTEAIAHISVGATAKLRVEVLQGIFRSIRILDPGSGYTNDNLPAFTITDPNAITEITPESRIGNGVLAQPDFIDRGAGYRRSTSIIQITGDGYADIIPEDNTLTLSGIENIPGPGVQIRITGILNEDTVDIPNDLKVFSGVEVFDLGDDGTGNGTRLVQFTITPRLRTENNLAHETSVTLRERYSQCRISGHDFLDIGTGNFEETNYPELYAGGSFFTAAPENEVLEANGGRVFYVSTDQDGNFRTGELFAVQQSTGVVTISAQFFDLDGLSELALGGVRLGGSGTVVNEFSTDPTFSADSNNVIPTQRAIATFLADRLSVGGENLEVNRLQAGRIIVGGVDTEIDNAIDGNLIIPSDVDFSGTFETVDPETLAVTTEPTAISGTIVSQMLFFKTFDETMQ